MASATVELPRNFTTTYGFNAGGGYDVRGRESAKPPMPAVPASRSRSVLQLQQQQQNGGGAGAGGGGAFAAAAAAASAPAVARSILDRVEVQLRQQQQQDAAEKPAAVVEKRHVGWEGLLDFSRNSGSSGVMGAKSAPGDPGDLVDCKLEACCTAHPSPAIRRLIKSVTRGLKACQEPERAVDGMGGTYFFMNEAGRKTAILKPCDEEPLAPNNPKGYVGRQLGDPGWKPTVRVGEAAMREVAACLLDHDHFAKVPTSVLVRARHPIFCYNSRMGSVRMSVQDLAAVSRAASSASAFAATDGNPAMLPMKLGSLQEFVHHECDTTEMGPSRFAARDVHRIGILDIRLFNTDRHAGNMLVRAPKDSTANLMGMAAYELIPIDHGFCLPETLEAPYFEWLHWPQTMLAFTDEELEYIDRLDVEADKELLRKELPSLRPECLRVMEVATTLLKRCAAAGLTLFDIATVMTRPFVDGEEEPSELEKLCVAASQHAEIKARCRSQGVRCASTNSDESDLCTYAEGAAGGELGLMEEGEEGEGVEVVDCGVVRTLRVVVPGGGDAQAMEVSPRVMVGARGDAFFDMDEDGSSALSPSAASPGSISSEDASMTTVTLSPASLGIPLKTPHTDADAFQQQQGNMARSVHVGAGFMWHMKGRHPTLRRSLLQTPSKPCMQQAYPPPVAALSPEALNGLFTGMGEAQWADFMEGLELQIEEALLQGTWRKGAADSGAVALSCPRF